MRTFGIERERFIVNRAGNVVPVIGRLLPVIHSVALQNGLSSDLFTYELFAGQVEDRTPPFSSVALLRESLVKNDIILREAANQLGFSFDYSEYMDESRIVSLEVNPFDERHRKIWSAIPQERRVAASVVAAVHIQVSVTEAEAVTLLNICREDVVEELIALGDRSSGKRIAAYRAMAETHGVPPVFETISEVLDYIDRKGGEKSVWDFVRYKPSTKTIEFRMFGARERVADVLVFLDACALLLERL